MRRRTFHLILTSLLLAWLSGCSTLQIKSDYDPTFDFSKLHTVAILYPQSSDDLISLAQQRFHRAVAQSLREKGFRIVKDRQKADFFILFHLNVTQKKQIVTDYQMVGLYPYYPGWYGYAALPVTREYSFKEGRFVVDAVDPKTHRIFWRGIAVDRLKDFKTPQARMDYIRQVVEKIFQNFPPKTQHQEHT